MPQPSSSIRSHFKLKEVTDNSRLVQKLFCVHCAHPGYKVDSGISTLRRHYLTHLNMRSEISLIDDEENEESMSQVNSSRSSGSFHFARSFASSSSSSTSKSLHGNKRIRLADTSQTTLLQYGKSEKKSRIEFNSSFFFCAVYRPFMILKKI